MRIWSIHPKFLDSKGLVAVWRETLLAKNVLEGNTKGYRHHPQLLRFRKSEQPINSINYYLHFLWKEASNRSYNFDKSKFRVPEEVSKINVTDGQMLFERNHLLRKLKIRDQDLFSKIVTIKELEPHPLFKIINGKIEEWEKE